MRIRKIRTHESVEIQHVDQLIIRVLNFCITNKVGISEFFLKSINGYVELECHYEESENVDSSNIVNLVKKVVNIQN